MHYHFVIIKTFNYKSEFNRVKLFLKLDARNVTFFIFSVDQSQNKGVNKIFLKYLLHLPTRCFPDISRCPKMLPI